ncbi:MAG: site-2 protease family protein [Symploca sp. SIO1B1]|nr:site-2 protease family protein [Symploca sp. SIO1A3]NER97863.1 site-2 protease family protein [Symploca sp. SIO1B1]
MELSLLLILLGLLLGLITYFNLQRSVVRVTRTPVWLLWLVMMTPLLIFSGWTLLYKEPPPQNLILGTIVVCPLLYWLLLQWGRRDPKDVGAKEDSVPSSIADTQPTEQPIVEESKLRPINKQEETELRNCFPWGVYYLQNVEYRPQAVLCRGKLRTTPEKAYQTVRKNIEAEFGDRFFLIFQESLNGKPFFALVPNPQAQPKVEYQSQSVTKPGLALGLLLITLFTTTVVGANLAGGTDSQSDPTELLQGLPYAVSLVAILGIHELGHYLAATYYKIRTTLPYCIPIPFIPPGTLGAFIQMRSPVPHRKALFDIGIAGPLAGLIVTIPLLLWGLANSQVVDLSEESRLWTFESLDPRFSFLLTLLSKWALGSQLTLNTAINLHPVAIAAYIGLIVTAFNLMPIGQLDGGHIVHAMLGQRTAVAIGQITRFLMLLLVLLERDLLIWAVILLFMPVVDEPALNDVSELDNWRDALGFLALVILVSIVLPPPGTITQLLNI